MEQLDGTRVVLLTRSHRERERSQWQDGCIAAIDVEEQPGDGSIEREATSDGEASDSWSGVHDAHVPVMAIGAIVVIRGPASGRLKEADEIDGYEEGEDNGMGARHLTEVVYAPPCHVHLHFREAPKVLHRPILYRGASYTPRNFFGILFFRGGGLGVHHRNAKTHFNV